MPTLSASVRTSSVLGIRGSAPIETTWSTGRLPDCPFARRLMQETSGPQLCCNSNPREGTQSGLGVFVIRATKTEPAMNRRTLRLAMMLLTFSGYNAFAQAPPTKPPAPAPAQPAPPDPKACAQGSGCN